MCSGGLIIFIRLFLHMLVCLIPIKKTEKLENSRSSTELGVLIFRPTWIHYICVRVRAFERRYNCNVHIFFLDVDNTSGNG